MIATALLRRSNPKRAWLGAAVMAASALIPSAASPQDKRQLTFEVAQRASKADRQRLISDSLGRQIKLVELRQWGFFNYRAAARLPANAERLFCSAAQLNFVLRPDPYSAPAGTRPGSVHSSRLPMKASELKATQVYRPYRSQLEAWRGMMGRDPCEEIDLTLPFFASENAAVAEASLEIFEDLIRAAADEAKSLPIECGEDEKSCRQKISRLTSDDIQEASDRCKWEGISASEQARCFNIGLRIPEVHDGTCRRTLLIIVQKTESPTTAFDKVRLTQSCVVS